MSSTAQIYCEKYSSLDIKAKLELSLLAKFARREDEDQLQLNGFWFEIKVKSRASGWLRIDER